MNQSQMIKRVKEIMQETPDTATQYRKLDELLSGLSEADTKAIVHLAVDELRAEAAALCKEADELHEQRWPRPHLVK